MAEDKPERPRFGKVVGKAAGSPVNLSVVGAAAVAAAAIGSWPILALGGAAYAALVAFDSSNPAFWKKTFASGGGAPPPKLPKSEAIIDAQTKASVERLRAARAELERVLAETPDEVRANLATVEASLDELEGRAARLVVRAEELARYLQTVDARAILDDVERLDERVKRVADVSARAELQKAAQARRDQLSTLDEITKAKERLDANLVRVAATVSGLPSKVVHMRALDAQAMDDVSGEMNAELERVVGEMRTFEETLKTLVEAPLS